jgi:hypothetical protein
MSGDLIAFLRARLDEDEAAAKAVLDLNWTGGEGHIGLSTSASLHIARHTPARVLREVAADRKLLAAYDEAVNGPAADLGVADALEAVIRDRAAAHDGHPDYRQEWKP